MPISVLRGVNGWSFSGMNAGTVIVAEGGMPYGQCGSGVTGFARGGGAAHKVWKRRRVCILRLCRWIKKLVPLYNFIAALHPLGRRPFPLSHHAVRRYPSPAGRSPFSCYGSDRSHAENNPTIKLLIKPQFYSTFLFSRPGVVTMRVSGVTVRMPLQVAAPWNMSSTIFLYLSTRAPLVV